jgi:hypothetical protein
MAANYSMEHQKFVCPYPGTLGCMVIAFKPYHMALFARLWRPNESYFSVPRCKQSLPASGHRTFFFGGGVTDWLVLSQCPYLISGSRNSNTWFAEDRFSYRRPHANYQFVDVYAYYHPRVGDWLIAWLCLVRISLPAFLGRYCQILHSNYLMLG